MGQKQEQEAQKQEQEAVCPVPVASVNSKNLRMVMSITVIFDVQMCHGLQMGPCHEL